MSVYLDDYPLTVCNDACRQYISRLDWKKLRKLIAEQRVVHFDISDAINVFPHLKFDDHYALYKNHIKDDSRYYEGHRCCVSNSKSIVIAERRYLEDE